MTGSYESCSKVEHRRHASDQIIVLAEVSSGLGFSEDYQSLPGSGNFCTLCVASEATRILCNIDRRRTAQGEVGRELYVSEGSRYRASIWSLPSVGGLLGERSGLLRILKDI